MPCEGPDTADGTAGVRSTMVQVCWLAGESVVVWACGGRGVDVEDVMGGMQGQGGQVVNVWAGVARPKLQACG